MSPSASKHCASLELTLSPSGRIFVDLAAGSEPPSVVVARRIELAFAAGSGSGLLHLGAVETKTELPQSVAFFRDLGRLFMTRLCAVSDLEEKRDHVIVELPAHELSWLVMRAPPFKGAEYLTQEVLVELWTKVEAAFQTEIASATGTVQEYLRAWSPIWNMVGRVCLHLAENKRDVEHPFAFLATYASGVSEHGKVQHLPLGRALTQYAGQGDRERLLALLLPVQRAAEESDLLSELVRSKAIYRSLRWSAQEAHRFLVEVPLLESKGLVVRVPAWWTTQRPPRPRVQVTMGTNSTSRVGMGALLDFSVELVIDGEPLTPEEAEALLTGSEGLVLVKGKWVEVDRELLGRVLDHWHEAQRAADLEGISFVKAMRLLAGTAMTPDEEFGETEIAQWSHIRAGEWLEEVLGNLRDPDGVDSTAMGEELHATLRPYQQVGVTWLRLLGDLGLGACLADDMGLGKTIQVLALLLLLERRGGQHTSLLVVPASLIANWMGEIERFAPSLRVAVVHPSEMKADALASEAMDSVDAVITSYGMLRRLPWLTEKSWDVVVLDEAQAIKNPGTKQTRAAKALKGRVRLALTGTPVENRLADLWSIFDFINPGLLGSAKQFTDLTRRMGSGARPDYSPLRELVRPYILRRLKTDKSIIDDLPEKTEVRAWCGLTGAQVSLYEQSVVALKAMLEGKQGLEGIERRGIVLAYLTRFKQICNHPSQWLGDDLFAPADSGKFLRLGELGREIADRQEKVLVFTQYRAMTSPLERFMCKLFGRGGVVLHGGTPVKKRAKLVEAFQGDGGPPFFVISLKAGGTGLNLTAASHVIHFDRWWNPAVENQATDRAYRIGQHRNVLVHKFICRGTVEARIDEMIEDKKALSDELLGQGSAALLTELSDDELIRTVTLDIDRALGE